MEVLVAIVLPVFTFGMLWFWQTGSFSSNEDVDEAALTNARSATVSAALGAVARIYPLPVELFKSADFNSLVDFTPEITPVPLGRPDPFSRPAGVNVVPADPSRTR